MMHAITYSFYKQLEKPLGLNGFDDYYTCYAFINRTVKQKLRTDAEKFLGYIPGNSALETDNTRALEGMSNYGVIGGPDEWNAESHVNSQLAREKAQNGQIKMMAYGKALNELYEKDLGEFAKKLANDVMTKEGYRKFRLHQEFFKRGFYGGTRGKVGMLPKAWPVFKELLTKEPYSSLKTEAQNPLDTVYTMVVDILDSAMDEISATKELNALLQSLYDVQKLHDKGNLDIVKMYNEQKNELKNNVFYKNLPEDGQSRYALAKLFDMCKLESQKLTEDERTKAPMVVLGETSSYELPTLAQIDEEWKKIFGTSQSQQTEPSVQETEDEFATCLRRLLADDTYYNDPLNKKANSELPASKKLQDLMLQNEMFRDTELKKQNPISKANQVNAQQFWNERPATDHVDNNYNLMDSEKQKSQPEELSGPEQNNNSQQEQNNLSTSIEELQNPIFRIKNRLLNPMRPGQNDLQMDNSFDMLPFNSIQPGQNTPQTVQLNNLRQQDLNLWPGELMQPFVVPGVAEIFKDNGGQAQNKNQSNLKSFQ